ncbi:Voltage-dependent calcium channel alpha-1 subunit [Penicillium riverlandense]|uniref:Voltage-dependent calcium channel alpha-1 subunit n=1 Tax=Penicillium riverlandense TaxID=1903569 RepID=UPI00254928C5|nr:Voltage-dependent calcium channel alpha-1 subunit [Penicillium riverlandense]KAJ5832696.1 Voltage-dependent calcium channel alpha-1 subunit [Penicillium riverlandense]
MASNRYNGHDNRPPASQIPLQDLSRPAEVVAADDRGRSRAGSVGSRLFSRRSVLRRGSRRNYESVAEESPVDSAAASRHHWGPSPYSHEGEVSSPIEDLGGFAMAMSSVGLSFDGPQPTFPSLSAPPAASRPLDDSDSSLDIVPLHSHDFHEPEPYTTPTEAQQPTARLTDPQFVQPISGAPEPQHQRNVTRGQSVHFADDTRLGDDLPHLEAGTGRHHRSRDRSRSLSPSAPGGALLRASSMVKSISSRVVNLSNEPEVIQQSIEREESYKHARLEGPPELPEMVEFEDEPYTGPRSRKRRRLSAKLWRDRNNPFRGRSLGILGPQNPLRLWLCDVLVHPFTEPIILGLILIQTVLLAIESSQSVWNQKKENNWGGNFLDFVFFGIFVIYTLEMIAKILVSGLVWNPVEYSTLNRSLGLRSAMAEKGRNLITPHRQSQSATGKKASVLQVEPQTSILRTFTGMNGPEAEVYDPLQKRRVRLAHRAFLRHSFNRLDFVAVVAYWVSFLLTVDGVEKVHQLYIFRMLSCLRILRLLLLTNGTSVILRSLKRAAPLLVHVAFLIGFFWLLFAVVGIQSFKSSLRRTCKWVDPEGQNNFTLNDPYNVLQFCGGFLDNTTGEARPWMDAQGLLQNYKPKGYICPRGSVCIEGQNPYNGTVSFDNIVQSLELVFVIMSSNTFTDLLYYTTDSDYLAAALFFACGLVILSLWLVNLLVAVITHSFQVIREESKRSAFAVNTIDAAEEEEKTSRKMSSFKQLYDKTEWLWVCVIFFDLVVQAMRSSTMGSDRVSFISDTEIVITIVLLVEIILRFASDWRSFHKKRRNWFDLFLVVVTCVIQIPPIRNCGRPYTVLTVFQILRVYRVVLAFSVTRNLIQVVFRNAVGLINLIIFVFLMTFLVAIFATQLFRSQIPENDPSGNSIDITFADIYNSFLGMYQIFSSENWTTILYNATAYTDSFNTAWISAAFIILWFILANFIILNMFIAVIQESFDVSEDEKRVHQVRAFLEQKQVHNMQAQGNLSLSKILRLGREDRYKDPLDHGPAALEMLLKDAVVREFLDEEEAEQEQPPNRRRVSTQPFGFSEGNGQLNFLSRLWNKTTTFIMRRETNPFYSKLKFSRAYEELDPTTMAKEVVSAAEQRKRAQREYLVKYPNYNKSLFIFSHDSSIRRFCQRIVGPGRGHQRAQGVDPYKPLWYTFSALIYAAIVAMVILACITTPLYQRQYFRSNRNWFVYTDFGFAVVFTVEAIIKVVADGFFWTPNAYFRSSWGFIDGIVLVTLWINVGSSLKKDWNVSRAIGAFKALRALRLLNVSDSAKDTFHSVIILGGWKVVAAIAVSMSFLIPFAIYAVNLYNGQMVQCNDTNFAGNLTACVNEWASSPYNWDVWAPRVATNPYYDFDNFGDALFILFQIVSQEGWIDVQGSAMSITGQGVQPQNNASPANGLFFVVFNLLGAVFVLTLFVSVFMRNYTEQTGVAFLTAEQRSWLELRKLLRQISPSKRSFDDKSQKWRLWCYRIAVKKHGRWARFVTCILVVHLLLLVLEFYPEPYIWELVRSLLFFAFMFVYAANVLIRLIGLGWHRFSRSSWDLFSLVAVPGALITTIIDLSSGMEVVMELNKLFLVAIALLLIPRNNQLDQLFKTAAASLTAISNLLATWFVLFLVYGIAMNQAFGLTKFGSNETHNLNFRDVPKSLILLFRMSCGEGWNQIMEDFATMSGERCTYDANFLDDDCGSASWARSLFISWNIISMYLFVSLFVSLIFESFSYVYQRSSGLYAISREEIRRFKQAWATFDPDGTGFITKEQFPRLLGELSGIFEMRIYDGEFTVGSILERCRVDPRDSMMPIRSRVTDGINLDELTEIINSIPVDTIRSRRQRLNKFYEEVLVSADPERGISFHSVLMILAHHNVITDSKSLRLEEFLRRRARLQRVDEAVRRNTVIGFFDTLYWSREFRRKVNHKKSGRLSMIPTFTVPEIFVDDPGDADEDEPAPGPMTPRALSTSDDGAPMLSPASRPRAESSPTSRQHNLPRLDTSNLSSGRSSGASSPTGDWAGYSPTRTPRHMYGGERSPFETDESRASDSRTGMGGDHSRQNSAMSVQEVMNSLENSAWGASIRRSFTQRRSGDRSGEP